MNKKQAIAEANKLFPNLKPSIPSSFAISNGVLIIAGENNVTIFYNKTDLSRLIMQAQFALEKQENEENI